MDKCCGKELGDFPLTLANLPCPQSGPAAQLFDPYKCGPAKRRKFVRPVPDQEIPASRGFGHAQMLEQGDEIQQQEWTFDVAKKRRGMRSPPPGQGAQKLAQFGIENRVRRIIRMVELDHH